MDNINDIYIKYEKIPFYQENVLENTSFLDTVFAKLELLLFTNKGEVLSDLDYGCDLKKYIYKTNFSAEVIQTEIDRQISIYIPELTKNIYNLKVYLLKGTYTDIGVIEINILDTTMVARVN